MAAPTEQVKLRAGLKVEIGNTEVPNVRSLFGGGLILPQVDTTTSNSLQQEFSTGRISYEPLRITFVNGMGDSTKQLITDAVKYFNDPQNNPRQTITVTELVRSDNGTTAGYSVTFFECFCTKLRLPQGNNQEGVLTTEMEWSIHRAEMKKGGIA